MLVNLTRGWGLWVLTDIPMHLENILGFVILTVHRLLAGQHRLHYDSSTFIVTIPPLGMGRELSAFN